MSLIRPSSSLALVSSIILRTSSVDCASHCFGLAFATGSIRSDRVSPKGVVNPLAAPTIGLDLGRPCSSGGLWVLAVALRTGGSQAHDDKFAWHLV